MQRASRVFLRSQEGRGEVGHKAQGTNYRFLRGSLRDTDVYRHLESAFRARVNSSEILCSHHPHPSEI